MPLINCKFYLELDWTKICLKLLGAEHYTNTKLYVPIVTLLTEDNAKLAKQLNDGFKIPIYWNEYQTKIESSNSNNQYLTRFYLNASFQGVKRLFVLAFNNN